MFDPETFQADVMKWVIYNFPNSQPHYPLLGLAEEMGELFDAIDKRKTEDVHDACGDIMIFLAQYCGLNGFDLMECISQERAGYGTMLQGSSATDCLVMMVGKLAHAHLKMDVKIRSNENHSANKKIAIGGIANLLRVLGERRSFDLTEVVEKVWSQVSKRDWIKYPHTGRPSAAAVVAKAIDDLMPPMEHFMPPTNSSWTIKHKPAEAKKLVNPCGQKGYKMPDKKNWSKEVPF